MKEITKEELNKIGFKRYGWDMVGVGNPETGIQVVFNTKFKSTEVRCINDSVPVDNCKSMEDMSDLMKLFNIQTS